MPEESRRGFTEGGKSSLGRQTRKIIDDIVGHINHSTLEILLKHYYLIYYASIMRSILHTHSENAKE